MKTAEYVRHIEKSFEAVTKVIFNELKGEEEAVFNLNGEESLFVRFNHSRVRQNIFVEQAVIRFQLQNNKTAAKITWPLTGDIEKDTREARLILGRLRAELEQLPDDPHLVKMENHGHSHEDKPSQRQDEAIVEEILKETEGSDMAGFFAGGPQFVANKNSKGQNHWFSSSNFFFDYSLYYQQKATKGTFASHDWNPEAFAHKIQESQNQLALMKRPVKEIKPGEYRVYLAPSAVNEIMSLVNWGALSQRAYHTGSCAFQKLVDQEKTLSPLITLREDFDLGWTPRFNAWGELSAQHLTLIEKGHLKTLLINSNSAMEYKIPANAANEGEAARSLEMKTGSLPSEDILKSLGTGLYISNLHYLNWSDVMMARFTGMTRYACFWVEKGEIVGPIQDLRFDETLYRCWGSELAEITNFSELSPGVSTYSERELGGKKVPGLLINKWNFTL